jgi:hypothetical protein
VSYRDDHDAALARADAAAHEARVLATENARLETELAQAREWLGGPRKRALVLGAGVVIAAVFLLIGLGIGRSTATGPAAAQAIAATPPPLPLPQVFGVIVSDGPELGEWTLNATRCVSRSDGIELTQQGDEGHNIWLTNNVVEVEGPAASLTLRAGQCRKKLVHSVVARDTRPATFDGYVDLDCLFDGNRLIGRIEFRNCR